MKFTETKIPGVWVIEMQRHQDERGWFARTWCASELQSHGLEHKLSQCSTSFNVRRGTLRGMHYQSAPYEEEKIIRCTRGSAFDVALDLRPSSPTYLKWTALELSAENGRALYIPKGCAHGFQTLEDSTEIFYSISIPYQPGNSSGVRWDDPLIHIDWPLPNEAILHPRDAEYPDLNSLIQ